MLMKSAWFYIEKILSFFFFKILHLKISGENWEKICQFVKFGIVGVSNTLISYVVYVILVFLGVHYMQASIIGFLISVVNAYYWNNKYVFEKRENEERIWWKTFAKTFLSYAGTGLLLNNILLFLWVDGLKIHEMLGPIINLFITVPLNFILNKFWAYRKKDKNSKCNIG